MANVVKGFPEVCHEIPAGGIIVSMMPGDGGEGYH